MPSSVPDGLAGQLRNAAAELERLRANSHAERSEVQRLLASIDVQFDAWLELFSREWAAATPRPATRALVERALLHLAVLRSQALALLLDPSGSGRT